MEISWGNMDREKEREERKKWWLHDKFIWNRFQGARGTRPPACLIGEAPQYWNSSERSWRDRVARGGKGTRGRVYIRTCVAPRGPTSRKRAPRYQFEAAYQNNGYIFINIWPGRFDRPGTTVTTVKSVWRWGCRRAGRDFVVEGF